MLNWEQRAMGDPEKRVLAVSGGWGNIQIIFDNILILIYIQMQEHNSQNFRLNQSMSNSRSMISRLPGNNEHALSSHLDIALLFQSAQIQRLSKIIQQLRHGHKLQSNKSYDRHSYEVQIKQLSNQVLLGKQELEKVTKLLALQANKYERALVQIEKMYTYNQKMTEQQNKLNKQIYQLTSQLERVHTVGRQKQGTIMQLNQAIQKYKAEAQQLKHTRLHIKEQDEQKTTRYEEQLYRHREDIQRLTSQLKEYQRMYHTLQDKCNEYDGIIKKMRQENRTVKQTRIQEYDDRIQQIQVENNKQMSQYRLVISNKQQQIQQLNHKILQYEQHKSLLSQIQTLLHKYMLNNHNHNHSVEYSNIKVALNSILDQVNTNNVLYNNKIHQLQQIIKIKQQHIDQHQQQQHHVYKEKYQQQINRRLSKLQEQNKLLEESLNRKMQIISQYELSQKINNTNNHTNAKNNNKIVEEYKYDLQMLQHALNQKLLQNSEYKSKDKAIKGRIREIRDRLDTIINIYQHQDHKLKLQIREYQRIIREHEHRHSQHQQHIKQYQHTIHKLQNTHTTIHKQYNTSKQQHKQQYNNLKQQYDNMKYQQSRLKQEYGRQQDRMVRDRQQLQYGMRKLEQQNRQLSQTVLQYKEHNYKLKCQTYADVTQEHVKQHFNIMKIQQLKKQLNRIQGQNMELREDIIKWKLQSADNKSHQERHQEILATLVLAFAQIQALRHGH